MRRTLFLLFSQWKHAWKIRAAGSRLLFTLHSLLFRSGHRFHNAATATRSLTSLVRLTAGDLFLATIAAIALQYTRPYAALWLPPSVTILTPDSPYSNLLTAAVGLGGLFIGLYYAAIASVGTSGYADAPNNIRDLLAYETVGHAYMRFVSILTLMSFLLLTFHVLGYPPVPLAALLISFGTGLAILGFVYLGTRAFNLLDPTVLCDVVVLRLHRHCTQVQAGSYRWSDPSFQEHAHLAARDNMTTLALLSDIIAPAQHLNGRPFVNLCKKLLSFLMWYESAKNRIPTDSRWYTRRYVHPHWYHMSDTTTSLAHDTGTMVPPHTTSDKRWIESSTLAIVRRCLEVNVNHERYELVNELLLRLNDYCALLAREDQVEVSCQLVRAIASWCSGPYTRDPARSPDIASHQVTICELLAVMPTNVLLAYSQVLRANTSSFTRRHLQQISWARPLSLYRVGFPEHVVTELEWLRPRLEFEVKVEGRMVTPLWYIQERLALKNAEHVRGAITAVVDDFCNHFRDLIQLAGGAQGGWLAAVFISREQEYLKKLNGAWKELFSCWADVGRPRRVEGLPTIDQDAFVAKKDGEELQVLQSMAEASVALGRLERPKNYPDFGGQFLHSVGEALLSAAAANEPGIIGALFGRYLTASVLQFERLRPENDEARWRQERATKVAVAPLLDAMDLAGYVILFAERYDNAALSEPVRVAWDGYVRQQREVLETMASAVRLTESAFELAHRSIVRAGWKQMVAATFEGAGYGMAPSRGGGPRARHPSAVVRAFEGRDVLGYDGVDVFVAQYVRRREGCGDLNFGSRRRRLDRVMERDADRRGTRE